jgi:hypothetical protein
MLFNTTEVLRIKAGVEFLGLEENIYGVSTAFYVRTGYDGIVDQ